MEKKCVENRNFFIIKDFLKTAFFEKSFLSLFINQPSTSAGVREFVCMSV